MSMEKEGIWVVGRKKHYLKREKVGNIIIKVFQYYGKLSYAQICIRTYVIIYTARKSNHIPRKVWGEITVPLMFRNG